ncbi:MAG: glycosyltransferase [Candidatus Moranbacteria bacterium]|nr:glycosyltransferase [Candidatus Moranbacteria bacterium]
MNILVSLIITTKNEAANIEACLKSILDQDFPRGKLEIIVVDNHSTDQTREIARKLTENVFSFGPERSAQRNFGTQKAYGKYVLYLDADMALSKNVIRECMEKATQNPEIIALYIPEKILGNSFWCLARNFERSFYDATPIDAVRFISREKFFEAGGFDENLTGPEDWDFDKKIRQAGKTDIISAPLFHSEGDFSFEKYLEKKKYYARDFEKYISKWGKSDPDIQKQFGFRYRYFGVFLENGKWKKLLQHPILTIGMYFLRILVGINYVFAK